MAAKGDPATPAEQERQHTSPQRTNGRPRMKLNTKLIATYLAIGLIPLAGIGTLSWSIASGGLDAVSEEAGSALDSGARHQLESMRDLKQEQVTGYFAERQGDMGVLIETVGTLREEAIQKLIALRDVKHAAVSRYFQTIRDQVITFAEDRMVVDAARGFKAAFANVRADNHYSDDQLQQMRTALRAYYTDEFAPKYQLENNGQSAPAESYFEQLDSEAVVLQYQYIRANEHPLGSKHQLDRATDKSKYGDLHAAVHPVIRSYLEKFGYYDIFIADPETGDIIYSVYKELDYATSLTDGPYAQTNFGEAFRRANSADNKDATELVDYARYAPSYDAPAGFVASPIYDGDEKVAIALFQMPIDRTNQIMSERSGLGDTGETYLIGSDLLMRSDSFLDPTIHSVMASFANQDKGKVDTEAAREAIAGNTGADLIIDYNGNPVLSAFAPLDIGGTTWGLLAEIDVAEALCPKDNQGKYFFEKYSNAYGYYDLFLINPDGYCFYTVAREADYQTNLVNGKYASSGLGEAVRECLRTGEFAFADFAPYAPSQGAPAAFIAQPYKRNGKVELIVALQLSDASISAMAAAGSDKERTLEAYLVGPDGHMRSNSILNPDGYSVAASFARGNKVSTAATEGSQSGGTDTKLIEDYLGSRVLSAWAPLEIFGKRWSLICEIDEAVAMASVQEMDATSSEANANLLTGVFTALLVVGLFVGLIAWFIARSISKPTVRMRDMLKDIAEGEGDLTKRLEAHDKDEIGQLALYFNKFTDKLQSIIKQIKEGAETVGSAATELSSTATQLAAGAEQTTAQSATVSAAGEEMATNMQTMASSTDEMSANVKTVASAVEEMTASVSEIAKNAEQAAQVADQAANLAGTSNDSIGELGSAANAIGKVVETIQEIAEQTNLLALNATIEAARAGDAGKGFAVVANEVKELAKQTAEATEDIRQRINGIQSSTGSAVTSIGQVSEVIGKVNEVSRSIASAVEEQSITTQEIARNIAQTAAAAETTSTGVGQSAAAADEITRNISGVDQAAQQAASSATQTQTAGTELSKLGEHLQMLVGQFKV